jgi:hypothetical protein
MSEPRAENSLQIGRAIQGNTVVSSLTVIPSLSSSEAHELFQKFIRTSTTLSTFSLMAKFSGPMTASKPT